MFRTLPWVVLALLFFSTARCYTADLAAGVGAIPFLGPLVVPKETPAYIAAIGTPAAAELPESDPKGWFDEADRAALAAADWEAMMVAAATARTPAGWAAFCGKVAAAAGQDRTAAPLLGALACSDDPSVTLAQRLALDLFDLRAAVMAWMLGAPGAPMAAVQARQAALRLTCANLPPGVLDGEAVASACAKGLDASYLSGDGIATRDAVDGAYATVAAAVAARDPTTEGEPATFDAATPP